jgi:hypothetical protein
VYDSSREDIGNWADDGAFMTRARDFGVESHVPALSTLIDTVRHSVYHSSLDMLSEKMWSYGHPMRYVERTT